MRDKKIINEELLQYSSTLTGKILTMDMDGFNIQATISQPYCFWPNSWVKKYIVKVYNRDEECIIKDTYPQPVSFMNIQNSTLTIYYNNSFFDSILTNISMITRSWNLSSLMLERNKISDINCLEYALMYHCAINNITKEDLKSRVMHSVYDKFSSSLNILPLPHD